MIKDYGGIEIKLKSGLENSRIKDQVGKSLMDRVV